MLTLFLTFSVSSILKIKLQLITFIYNRILYIYRNYLTFTKDFNGAEKGI